MGLLQCGVMRDTLELQDPAEVGPLGRELDGAPVVELEELSQDEDGEELMLGEVLARTDGGVFGQRLPGGCQPGRGAIWS